MKKALTLLSTIILLTGCGGNSSYTLTENTFFMVMTNIQYYPEEYLKKDITFDCFTYELESTSGDKYLCGVRKCSSGFGCKCGKDTIIGFILNPTDNLPQPIKQYEDSNEKAWIHLTGQLHSDKKKEFKIYTADQSEETVQFLTLNVSNFNSIEDYSGLHYYVDK